MTGRVAVNLRFLCANHHRWLAASSRRAEQAWLNWRERGARLSEARNFAEAIPYLGCAFELADHLLGARWPGYRVAAVRFGGGTGRGVAALNRGSACYSPAYVEIGIRPELLVQLLARRQLVAADLRGLTPRARRQLRRALLRSLLQDGRG